MNDSVVVTLFVIIFLIFTPVGFSFGFTILTVSQFLIALFLAVLIVPFCELLKFLQKRI